ncbi:MULTISPECIES: 2-oxo-4-hydroxy-4-carboxy-5-ureidoimidazoline decarboxylase [Bacillaceae]|uniref:2-oxo-4-hydroxy-4-carboxy-5-ureidoimidazoline decarboxylase n=1 Tax=Bacillaceae TaxID=186817 RepID=UPI001E3F04B2|nr:MULTISPECIES: 2-oxo-4-hydroxy-4-carboxy-5-ureidoimidazoline decarboxylase [Bacillaceae]MCE4047816.1 2-oxo-4-hydroxy-4-carboxy-5-ureidoimidazoline decarboxylase [Bacillus sp. Au-Bac7]MDL0434840.1 2-oxo-4-hydroxy-4-carboxy-5-ureidoimidazoline decarboxylase [Niallia sp. SS-2023]UPO89341.1 2-oxo-4-hydroxy-4-carboxy-5-ureidoimidazoline decarboxylase [Niallia sp. Man26]
MYTIAAINAMSKNEFIEKIGWVFEHSPWVADRTWERQSTFESLQTLHHEMVKVVREAAREEQLDLIRAHPDLGGKIKMTQSSVNEQKGAGLDTLSKVEYESFLQLNNEYRTKFHFPFILAVKGHTKDSIYEAMKGRIHHTMEEEFETALSEIFTITFFRLEGVVQKVLEA